MRTIACRPTTSHPPAIDLAAGIDDPDPAGPPIPASNRLWLRLCRDFPALGAAWGVRLDLIDAPAPPQATRRVAELIGTLTANPELADALGAVLAPAIEALIADHLWRRTQGDR